MATKVKFIKPHLRRKVGFVTDQLNEGVVATLLYLGVCEKVDEDSKLDDRKKDKSRKQPSKSRRSKSASKSRRDCAGCDDPASCDRCNRATGD